MTDDHPVVLAVDPGRDKCGVAVVRGDGAVLERLICARAATADTLKSLLQNYANQGGVRIVLGHATTSRALREELEAMLESDQQLQGVALATVDETGSTLEARVLYWQAHPPRGWRRLLPLSLQTPPRPVDDFAAVVLAQRFLQGLGVR